MSVLSLLLLAPALVSSLTAVGSEDGSFVVRVGGKTFFKSADTCFTVSSKTYCASDKSLRLTSSHNDKGTDAYGVFNSTVYEWNAADVPIQTSIRSYADEVGTVIFKQYFPQDVIGTSVGNTDMLSSSFPSIVVDGKEGEKGFLQYLGDMLGSRGTIGSWSNTGYTNKGGLENTGPLVVFSSSQTIVISCASEFMACSQLLSGNENKTLGWGVMGGVTMIPAGYEMEIIFSSGVGVSSAMDEWGNKLLARYQKDRETANSDFTTNYLSYSTDNGAYYYYLTETGKTYEDTIIDVKSYADEHSIPYRNWLMDSWWYYKGPGDGVKNWTAMPSIFPHGADYVFNKTQWPVVAHNRYWAADTDYAKQNGGKWDFIIEPEAHGGKGLAFPVEQAFWDFLLADARKWGLSTYEQDWLFNEFSEMTAPLESATLARQWLIQMGTAAERNGLTIQYCMSWCRHMLQSLELQAVTQARASGDYHPGNDQWKIGISSILAHAIAISPSKDNYWSTPTEAGRYGKDTEPYNRLQAAVSSFSTGPVAPSDMLGGSDAPLIMKSCAADGRLLQPDRPAVRTDLSIFAAAGITGVKGPDGETWQTEVTLSFSRFLYLLCVNNSPYVMGLKELSGQSEITYVTWEANSTSTPQSFSSTSSIHLPATNKHTFNVWTAAPVMGNGMVFMGEASSKWVAVSNDRFSDLFVDDEGMVVSLSGPAGEKVYLMYMTSASATPVSFMCVIPSQGTARARMPRSPSLQASCQGV